MHLETGSAVAAVAGSVPSSLALAAEAVSAAAAGAGGAGGAGDVVAVGGQVEDYPKYRSTSHYSPPPRVPPSVQASRPVHNYFSNSAAAEGPRRANLGSAVVARCSSSAGRAPCVSRPPCPRLARRSRGASGSETLSL